MFESTRLVLYWQKAGIRPGHPATESDISDLRSRTGAMMPSSFEQFLRQFNGIEQSSIGNDLLTFWSIGQILSFGISSKSGDFFYIPFADYCLNSHIYILRLDANGVEDGLLAADVMHERIVANSFDEFISLYLDDPIKLTQCWDSDSTSPRVDSFEVIPTVSDVRFLGF